MCYTPSACICMPNFAAVRCTVLEEIGDTHKVTVNYYIVECLKCHALAFSFCVLNVLTVVTWLYNAVTSLISRHLIWHISSELSALRLVAATANWITSQHMTLFTVTLTIYSAHSVHMSVKMGSDDVRWTQWYKHTARMLNLSADS